MYNIDVIREANILINFTSQMEILHCHLSNIQITFSHHFPTLLRRGSKEGKMKVKRGEKGKGTSARCHTLVFLKPGVP